MNRRARFVIFAQMYVTGCEEGMSRPMVPFSGDRFLCPFARSHIVFFYEVRHRKAGKSVVNAWIARVTPNANFNISNAFVRLASARQRRAQATIREGEVWIKLQRS